MKNQKIAIQKRLRKIQRNLSRLGFKSKICQIIEDNTKHGDEKFCNSAENLIPVKSSDDRIVTPHGVFCVGDPVKVVSGYGVHHWFEEDDDTIHILSIGPEYIEAHSKRRDIIQYLKHDEIRKP